MFSSSIRHIAPKSLYPAIILILAMIGNAAADDACHLKHEPQRVYSANPVVTYLMMAMAPEKLVGWNFPPPPQARGIFSAESFDKPVIGGWFGQGRTPNMEELIRSKPDLMLLSGATVNTDQQRVVEKLGVPVCYLKLDRLTDYPQDLRNLGHWLGKAQRGEKLAQEVEQILNRLTERKRKLQAQGALKTVYYAESTSGLATECRGSIHSEAIPLAGGINPHICPNDHAKQSRFGRVDINFEQLLRYNPDAIVTQEIGFYERVYQDAKWRSLKAVQNRQVFFMPQVPFRWMDRPPSFMRLLAAEWLMAQLYPQSLNTDLLKVSGDFIETFFQVRPDDAQLKRILNGEIVDERR